MTGKQLQGFAGGTQPDAQRQFVEELRRSLIRGSNGCLLQQGADGRPWPCGTCVCHLLAGIIDQSAPEYGRHNEPPDRVNEVWRAILQIRDLPTQ